MNPKIISLFAQLDVEESFSVKQIMDGLEESQQEQFAIVYLEKRRDSTLILLCILTGFIGFAGIQRLITDRIVLRLAYFFTGGFLLIGTIIDLFRYKKTTRSYNQKVALETASWMGVWKN